MKNAVRSLIAIMIILIAFTFSSCYEPQYYHTYHHHTREWYDHRHEPPPAGVNFEIDVRARKHHRD